MSPKPAASATKTAQYPTSSSNLKVYHYPACSTCKKALKFLDANEVPYEAIHIVEHPPTKAELRAALEHIKAAGGMMKSLFNTSGLLYKEMKLSEKFPSLSEAQAIELLAAHGKLIKRPFVVGIRTHALGFNEKTWQGNLADWSQTPRP